MIDFEQLAAEAAAFGILLTAEQQQQFDRYAEMLVDWNTRINLTGITDPAGIVTRHFADSLSLLAAAPLEQGARVADVGAGAGFPSVPIKIVRPDIKATLLDSLGKRITFLEALSHELGQTNTCAHIRAEDAGQRPGWREGFDLVSARAVAHLRELSEFCLPLVKIGGVFAAMKSGEIERELVEAAKAIAILGGEVIEVKRFSLADTSARTIIVIKKISQTSTKYPRPHAKMVKRPL